MYGRRRSAGSIVWMIVMNTIILVMVYVLPPIAIVYSVCTWVVEMRNAPIVHQHY